MRHPEVANGREDRWQRTHVCSPATPADLAGNRMYIEEVILEGFKSYATRTVISGWDREFNAITGLNGTGKSNILDAICFVLGIDNLRQALRANRHVYVVGARDESAGPGVQARPGGHHQGLCDHRL